MAPISPGKMSGPPRKPKKPTATTKAHRFEGFSKRIAKVKIDPVHTVQKSRLVDDHNDLANSFFRSALEEWAELNLSATFTSFLNKAQPLSESLPQLLHHADALFSLLHTHIAKQDALALEPLLSLVAHLAHDLGQAFEGYFASTVKLVAQVSASVNDPAAIESCFTCLAWMFKYLSRSLVQDMRPLLEIMIPYFSSKKDYIRRFSAESLAFLLRKAAVLYTKKQGPLQTALGYLFNQLEQPHNEESDSFDMALMMLSLEAAIGVDAQLHSSAVDLLKCMFDTVGGVTTSRGGRALSVLDGTVVGLIHQTDAKGFQPLLDLITGEVQNLDQAKDQHRQLAIRLLLDVTTTRKGSRILDWNSTIQPLLMHLQSPIDPSHYDQTTTTILLTIGTVTMQYCPMNQLLPHIRPIIDSVVTKSTASEFFAFCEMVADLGPQRFHDLLLQPLQQYIITHWSANEDGVCFLLERLRQKEAVTTKSGEPGYLALPKVWEKSIIARLESVESLMPRTAAFPEEYAKYFHIHKAIHFPSDESLRLSLQQILEASVSSGLKQLNSQFDLSTRLSLGWAFELYLATLIDDPQSLWKNLASNVIGCRPEYYQLLPFLECCLDILNRTESFSAHAQEQQLIGIAMCNNMLSESHGLKKTSLEILRALGRLGDGEWISETCDLLLEILAVPYLPSNARQITMLTRRLPKQQELCDKSSVLFKLVPYFALGSLRNYHDQTRRDLCIAIGRMTSNSKTEEIILDVVTTWLHKPDILEHYEASRTEEPKPHRLSPFECSNQQAIQKLSDDAFARHSDARSNLQQEFERAHMLRPATTPSKSRVLALQVFLEVPEVAERRSKALSPVFLSIQQVMGNYHVPESDESTSSHTVSPDFNDKKWSLMERKLFLELMGKFINPRVLYRSRELHDHLLELLTNGNSDIRRLAFIALLNWKDPSLAKYRDVLLRVAEEKNATTELASLLASDEDTGSIQSVDRQNVLPFLLRLIFGQLVGRAGTHGAQETKRKSILRLLFRMEEQEINLFLGIALGRLNDVSFQNQSNYVSNLLTRDLLSRDQQYGFLRMMQSIQDILQSHYRPYGKKVVDAVLYCTARACYQTNNLAADDATGASPSALVRNIRRSGVQCLSTIFEYCEDIDWNQYLPIVFGEIIDPRVPNLAIELAQDISGLLRIFSVWAKSRSLLPLLKHNNQLSTNLWGILAVPSARDDVKVFVLQDILMPLLDFAADTGQDSDTASAILKADIEPLLQSFVVILQKQPSKDVLLATTKCIPLLASFVVSSNSANDVLNLLITLLCEPAQRIPPHVKGQLLSATESLLVIQQKKIDPDTHSRLYSVVASLFNYFKDQPNRIILGKLLSTLVGNDTSLQPAVQICQDLNAVSTKNLGEIDYESQLSAYTRVNSLVISSTVSQLWLPILNNLLYYARTAEDYSIRSNAVSSLKLYVIEASQAQDVEIQNLVLTLLLPACKKGIKESSEVVRADFVLIFGLVVRHLPNAPELEDMKILLVGDDDEASFFTNVLHIQQHRRVRAIRRLLTEVERGAINPSNVTDFFLPLLEKFIDDEDVDESGQGVKGQSIAAVSTLLQWVDWKSFRTKFRQYRSDLDTAARPEKDAIKLLSNAADALSLAKTEIRADTTGDSTIQPHLMRTLPSSEIVASELRTHFIPRLSKFIHHKNEAEISLRVPVAKVAVKLIQLLPPDEVPALVAPIVLDVSQILRSRAQESRDTARNTLAELVLLLGSSSLQFVLREMRTTLTRGYQLHVLSYTLHTILLQSAGSRNSGDLDYCLEDLVSVIMDDIFGVVGQEKENQDYISGMKEVKSSKSQDSLELLAKSAGVKHLSKLVRPFQTLLAGNLTTRQIRQVDELFRRIGVGISHNPAASNRDLLVFAYELIQAFYQQKAAKQDRILTNDEKNKQRFLIQLKGASETTSSRSSSLQYKIVRFALDIVRSTFSKTQSLLTPENAHGFLPILGDALVEAQEDVRISAFRLLSTIIKLPLAELDNNAKLYVMEAVKVVKDSISTNEESSQAALKLVTAVLRDRKDVEVRDSDIAYLLHKTMPDIEEPDRQGVTFNFIKAVMARKYQLVEVYELMDKVSVMMVTNQSRSGRDVARGVFVHFLLEYPQSKARWTKQLKFLVKNLEFEFREGRQSVMEAVHVLFQKLQDEILQEAASIFFIPVVLRMANDDDSGCREMAGALLAQIFGVVNTSQLVNLLEPLRSWLEQTENPVLAKVSMQAWMVYFNVNPDGAEAELPLVRKALARVLHEPQEGEDGWEVQFQSLELFSKLTSAYPATTMTRNQSNIWTNVRQLLQSRQEWVQISAAKLIGAFFLDCADSSNASELPLTGRYGLRLDGNAVLDILRNSVRSIKRNYGNIDLAQRTSQNLLFLGKFVEQTKLTCEVKANVDTESMATNPTGEVELDPESDSASDSETQATTSIPAIQYVLDQLILILRREPNKMTTIAFTPRISALNLLNSFVLQLSTDTLSDAILTSLLTPLTHITDPSLQQPRSADPTFAATYQEYTELANGLQESIQRRFGDATYVKLMTDVAKIVRQRRGERKIKRAFDRVAEPERAQREKRRKQDMKARRKKVVVDIHRKRRRGDLGF